MGTNISGNHSRRSNRPILLPLSLLALVLAFSGCAKPLLSCPRVVREPEPPLPPEHPAVVLFATDRLPESREQLLFSADLNPSGTHLSYGAKCVDPTGGKAECDAPPRWLERDDFLERIRASRSDVVLFVHGFNYSFDESLEIALRIVERTTFRSTPVAYSWPSQARVSAYGLDYDMSEWTIDHLTGFIGDLVGALPEGSRLHIIAHSMGNRAVLLALARLELPGQRLGQLILIAPDVESRIFRELVAHAGPFQRRTLYVSRHDLALRASAMLLRSGTMRAGDADKQYIVVKEVDTIDMSPLRTGVVGHSIYDYPQLIFEDLGAALRDQSVADRKLTACTVKSIAQANADHGTSLPCLVYVLPSQGKRSSETGVN
jgi:esterase/lipase superfamily enzyme